MAQFAKFKDVAQKLRGRIENGEFSPGCMLPSENELAVQFGISRASARKALGVLEEEQLISRQAGVGSFVRRIGEAEPERRLSIGISNTAWSWYTADIFETAHKVCSNNRAQLIFSDLTELSSAKANSLNGTLILAGWDSISLEKTDRIAADGLPVALLNRISVLPNIAYCAVDYEQEARNAVNFLFRFGCKRVAVLQTPYISRYADATRTAGYAKACAEHGKTEIRCLLEDRIDAVQKARDFLSKERPDGVFLTMRYSLDSLLFACRDLGIRPGKDLAVLCFDKVDGPMVRDENITFVDMPLREMTECAIQYLIDKGKDRSLPVLRRLFKTALVMGSSAFAGNQ